jgi:hypothetical protein
MPAEANALAAELLRVANDPELRTWNLHSSTRSFVGNFRNRVLDEAAGKLKVFENWKVENNLE